LWIDCGSIAGSGFITANGSVTNSQTGTGGGGGRIHLLYNTKGSPNPVDLQQVYASGGGKNGYAAAKGAAGTALVMDRGVGKESLRIGNDSLADSSITYTRLPDSPTAWTFDSLVVNANAAFHLQDGRTLTLSSALSNANVFVAEGDSTVELVGTGDAVVYGVNTFANFSISNTAPKTVRFEPGTVNTVNKHLSFFNATLRSVTENSQWRLVLDEATGSQLVTNVIVRDSNASGGQEIDPNMPSSVDLGNNLNWKFAVPPGSRYIIY
jgi:hypothetical protein